MRVVRVAAETPEREVLREAADLLRAGELVAFPTETVYGLGAHALDPGAVGRIYEVKGRPPRNPLIVHVPDADAARALAEEWPDAAERLANAFWPGPLTLVVRKRSIVPDIVTAGADTVGLRVPAHPVALALLREARIPIAAPSANRSTNVSPTTAQHVVRGLERGVALVLDGGPTSVGIESTVVDVSGSRPRVLRPGMISREAMARVVGAVDIGPGAREPAEAPRSPGLMGRHYAPRARVRLFRATERDLVVQEVRTAVARRAGIMSFGPFAVPGARVITMPETPADYARMLYATLHELDDVGCDVVFVERPPETPEWAAVLDRLERGAV